MDQNMKLQFLSLAEDIHVYILTFLPYRDILRCTSVSITLLVTVDTPKWNFAPTIILQYIVELGGQQLLLSISRSTTTFLFQSAYSS
ncbi:hypothetical protein BDR07DRAFT_1495028 [Suillus spraguei]|nr:hypothetical protein BDR07DRAFT_1495028 [Suillus spraguei]